MTWTEQDPGQGDPAGIACLPAELRAVSDAAVAAKTQLQALENNTSDAIWRGTTADAFRNRIAQDVARR